MTTPPTWHNVVLQRLHKVLPGGNTLCDCLAEGIVVGHIHGGVQAFFRLERRGEARILNGVTEYRHTPKAVSAHGVKGHVVGVWEGRVGQGEVNRGGKVLVSHVAHQ